MLLVIGKDEVAFREVLDIVRVKVLGPFVNPHNVGASVGMRRGACSNRNGNQDAVGRQCLAPSFPSFFLCVPLCDEGGVVRLARLQAQGYAYLRP